MPAVKVGKFSKSIMFKILLVFVVLILPLNILVLLATSSYIHSLQAEARASLQSLLQLNSAALDEEEERLERFDYTIQYEESRYSDLSGQTDANQYVLSKIWLTQQVQGQLVGLPYRVVVYFYREDLDDLLLVVPTNMGDQRTSLAKELKSSVYTMNVPRWTYVSINGLSYCYRTAISDGAVLGTMIVLDDLAEAVNTQLDYEQKTVAIEPETEYEDSPVGSFQLLTQTEGISVTVNSEEIVRRMPLFERISRISAVIYLILIPILLIFFWKTLLVPLGKIRTGLKRLENGEQNYRIQDMRASIELEEMADDFNSMADTIQSLKIEAYEKKLEQEQMHLQNILLQTRPHFLLNTFNQIYSMAQLHNDTGVQKMALYLADYFRYLYVGKDTRSIESEMKLIYRYLDIMRLQYPDCFTVKMKMDPELMECRVPPLLIHNFVENIFKYAISDGMETEICFILKRSRDLACLIIQDDGSGMDPAVLKSIQAGKPIDRADGRQIGIWNSRYRLLTFCGERASLQVESVLSEGTKVTIYLPLPDKDDKKNV